MQFHGDLARCQPASGKDQQLMLRAAKPVEFRRFEKEIVADRQDSSMSPMSDGGELEDQLSYLL